MKQTSKVIAVLKSCLKARGLTYADVARHLKLSEPTIKRSFASENLSLARLDEICELLDIDMTTLLEMVAQDSDSVDQLSYAQESALAADVRLLLVMYLLLNDWQFEAIIRDYDFDEHTLVQRLAQLDRLGLIELQPRNRVRLKISRAVKWRADGPIRRFFDRHVLPEFLAGRFEAPGEQYLFVPGLLTDESIAAISKRMSQMASEFNDQVKVDGLRRERRYGCSLMLAMRKWEYSAFGGLRRMRDD
ncbi:MAG: helix-turn-helix transcriptional regulator [Gammaproteobacteria bacterium]|nr:helix-turn-helix transcriptional regulator [Gammaproteobacteria bacterium]